MDRLSHIIHFLPFICLTAQGVTLDKNRILEGLIIGSMAGLMGAFITVQRMDVKLEAIQWRLGNIEKIGETVNRHETRLSIVEERQHDKVVREMKEGKDK